MSEYKIFDTEKECSKHFGKLNAFGDKQAEECEMCGRWSVSMADHGEGAIVSLGDEYAEEYECWRICLACDDKVIKEKEEKNG